MDEAKLAKHVKLCRKNQKSNRVKCCAACPFEKQIVERFPHLQELFEAKRRYLRRLPK